MQTSQQLRFVSAWIALTVLISALLIFALFYQTVGA